MSQIVRIEVRLPDDHWAGEVTRNNPNSVLQIIETMPLGKGRGTAQIAAEQDLLSDLENLRGVERVNLLGDNKASVTIASGGGGFIKPLRIVGVVPRTPFDVIDGWADWTIQCSTEQAKQLVKEIELQKQYGYKVDRKLYKNLKTNKPMKELDFHELVTGMASGNTEGQVGQTVLFGGPVEFQRGFLLHSSEYYIPGKTLKLGDNYNLTNDTKALEDVCEGKGPISSVFTLGYSGWSAGQLEREILAAAWLVAPAAPSIVFGRNYSQKYDFSLSSIGINNGYLASKSGSA